MQYVGGKFRQRKQFVPAILNHTPNRDRYLEPFVGGGSMLERMAPHFEQVRASDTHEDLILMYRALQGGWEPPLSVTREEYRALRHAAPSALRGFVGFGCSFGGKWFGGYASNRGSDSTTYATRGAKNVLRTVRALPEDTVFSVRSFEQWKPQSGTVVYCDPPYERRGVEYKTSTGFPHELFWRLMDEWVKRGVHVFVSEFNAPPHWTYITESVQRLTIAGNTSATKKEQGLQYDRLWVPMSKFNGYGPAVKELKEEGDNN